MPVEKIEQSVRSKPRLIIFDVEGVLIPKRRYLLFEASRLLSLWKFLKMLWTGFLYEIGFMPLGLALRTVFKQLKGLSLSDLFRLYKKIPLIPSVKEAFEKLKEKGYKTALISSGLPQQFVQDLASQLGADYAVGLNLEVAEGRFTGDISGDVIKHKGKALALKKIMEKEGLTANDCALVADDRNNLPMFKLCAMRVGYNPDFLLSAKSDVVVRGDFSEVLPPLTAEKPKSNQSHSISRQELIRETIHIGGFLLSIVSFYLLSRYLLALLIFLVTSLYVISELARMQGFNIPITSTITLNAAIKPEMYEFVTAPISYAIGIMLALIIFPEPVVGYASIAILTIGDGFATLLGKKIGRHVFPYNKGKRVEGTISGFLFASLGASLFVPIIKAILGAAVGMLIESLPAPVSDNLTIPIISGIIMTLIP